MRDTGNQEGYEGSRDSPFPRRSIGFYLKRPPTAFSLPILRGGLWPLTRGEPS